MSSYYLIAGIVGGVVTGLANISFLDGAANLTAHIFKNLLSLVSIPLIFLSITSTVTGMDSKGDFVSIGRRIFSYTLLTTVISGLVALLCYFVIDPAGQGGIGAAVLAEGAHGDMDAYWAFILSIVPANFFQAMGSDKVMSVVFLAVLMSFATLSLPTREKKTVHEFLAAFFQVFLGITGFVIALMPLGVWAFVTEFTRAVITDASLLSSLWRYGLTVLSANLVQGVLVIPLLLLLKGLSPRRLFTAFRPALTLAFFSKSSSATLPVSMKCATENAGISERISKLALPLCTTINMNGCAAFILITILFVGSLNGIVFTFGDIAAWLVIATIAAIGNAGVPMGCFFLTSAFLTTLGVPLAVMGAILPLYTLIDMVETTLNVWSDSAVTALVDQEESR